MKKFLLLTVSLAMFAFAPFSMAADASTANVANANVKIGVIDLQKIVQQSPQMKDITNKLNAQFKPREAKMKDIQDNLNKNYDKLKRDSAVMSADDRNKLQDSIIEQRGSLAAMQTAFQRDVSLAQDEAMQKLLTTISNAINDIATKQGYSLVLQKQDVPFYQPSMEITDQVITQLKKA